MAAATEVFQKILQSIENSRLNYSLSKTPFSASISLKCSFIKRFEEHPQEISSLSPELASTRDTAVIKELVTENYELKAEVDRLNDVSEKDQKRLLDEQVTLQEVYENEKVKCKQPENDVS